MITNEAYVCATCGATHAGLAMVLGPSAPDPWVTATDAERASGELNADTCVLPDAGRTLYFVRGHIEIPVHDSDDGPFVWSVWVSLSEANIQKQARHWDDSRRAGLEPMFAWLSTHLPYDVSTAPLPTRLHTRPPGQVPWIELRPDLDHPLVHEWHDGITLHRVAELDAQARHG